MSHKVFSAPASGLVAQATGAKLYFRSTSASDTDSVSLTGIVSATPTTETNALLGKQEVQTSGLFSTISSVVISDVEVGTVKVYNSGTGAAADGRIIVSTNPANNDNVRIGLVGFLKTYVFKTSISVANDVLIGATAADTATNLNAAINHGSGEGTLYGTGTTANDHVSSSVSGSTLTITDRIPCRRQLAWTVDQTTGATLSIAAPTGGTDGTLMATLLPGAVLAARAITLDSENLSAITLPGLATPTTSLINLTGRPCCLRFKSENLSYPVSLKYQTSTDGVNWSDGVTSITDLDDNTVLAPQFVVPGEQNIEKIRLVITTNNNPSDIKVDARVIYPR